MYYDYYGLRQAPFKITPDTNLFFPGGDRGVILDALIYAIVSGEGIVKLVGEVGSGKTTLCRMLEKELPKNVEIVYLANPSLSPDNILHAIAFELHLKVQPDDSRLKVMNSLQNYLLERYTENKQIVVFVEEAQSMPITTLEEIRLLSNLETSQNKLLQIVLFGQPELDAMISRQEIRQLKERITYSFYLAPLKTEEIRDYINSRLRACGYRSPELFNEKAIKLISKYSNGLLRRINILADKATLASYAANASIVNARHVKLAARETEFVNQQEITALLRWGLIILFVFIISTFSVALIKSDWLSVSDLDMTFFDKIGATDLPDVNTVAAIGIGSFSELMEKESAKVNITEHRIQLSKTEESVALSGLSSAKPRYSEPEQPERQKFQDKVLLYPKLKKATILAKVEPISGTNDLPGMRDLIGAVGERDDDESALLKQLAILPSEVAINHESVANELTCKLCSTIIYRPLKK